VCEVAGSIPALGEAFGMTCGPAGCTRCIEFSQRCSGPRDPVSSVLHFFTSFYSPPLNSLLSTGYLKCERHSPMGDVSVLKALEFDLVHALWLDVIACPLA
jgi:hypothetical protein